MVDIDRSITYCLHLALFVPNGPVRFTFHTIEACASECVCVGSVYKVAEGTGSIATHHVIVSTYINNKKLHKEGKKHNVHGIFIEKQRPRVKASQLFVALSFFHWRDAYRVDNITEISIH